MRKALRITLTIFLIILLTLSTYAVCFFSGYKTYKNVRYADAENCVMDIYIPKKAYNREYNGCVLFIHGGSWSGGDKKEEFLRCRYVANKGYITASINYTLYSEATADTYDVGIVLDEISAALAYLKNFAKEKGITIDKAAVSGYSAGAHLSMLYAYSRAETSPLEIVFTANLVGPADLNVEIWGERATVVGERLSGQKFTAEMLENGQAEKILYSLSPTSYITESSPPSIFVYGGKDTTVDKANGESLKAKFDGAGVDYDYIFLPKANHLLLRNLGKRLSYPRKIIEYCKKYFA